MFQDSWTVNRDNYHQKEQLERDRSFLFSPEKVCRIKLNLKRIFDM